MKPHQLIAALMHREKTGPYPLSRRLGIPSMQGQIHRYVAGETKQPSPSTVQPLARHFGLPLEAFYDEKVATAIAKERGIEALPEKVAAKRPEKAVEAREEPGLSEWATKAAMMLDGVQDEALRQLIYTAWLTTLDAMVTAARGAAPTAGRPQADSPPKRLRRVAK